MNKSLIYLLLFLPLFALSACSDAERFDTEQQQPSSRQALTLSVFASDFATYSDGALDTRATNNGNTITFASGDRVGVIITDASGNLSADNIPYTYKDGTGWAFDAANNEGKTPCYYDNKATTYIVYYPYSPKANGITTADDLKAKFKPLFNQSTEAAYSASDLLLYEKKSDTPLIDLSVTLAHAYASVSIVPKVTFTLEDKANTVIDYSSSISNVSFAIGDDIFVARPATDGSYCCIFPASGSNVAIRYVYTCISKIFRGTLTSSGTAANTRYTSTSTYSETYTFADAELSDFYCKDKAGKTYLIPGGVATLTPDQQTACLGIVYWLGDTKDDNYGLLNSQFPGGTHGLVACKQVLTDPGNANAIRMTWTYGGYSSVNAWLENANWTGSTRPPSFTSIQVDNKMQGYANTVALQEYNKAKGSSNNERAKPIVALATFAGIASNSAPGSSSGWYWPSAYELGMMCWGQGNTEGVVGRDMLNKQFDKVGGTTIAADPSWIYWSSTESITATSHALRVHFSDGSPDTSHKNGDDSEFLVRPVLAF